MAPEEVTTAGGQVEAEVLPQFTLEQANRALVLVQRIVAAIVSRYEELMDVRHELEQLRVTTGRHERAEELNDQTAHCIADLNDLNRELATISCVLKDWRVGLVDFPAVYQGHRVWLCWRLGEATVTHWHDWEEGFAGRKPIGHDWAG
jgi:hypothetical protein